MKHKILMAVVLTTNLALASHSVYAAPLQNGNFSSGFTAWTAEITDSFSFAITAVDPVADPHFDLVGGLAKLANDFDFFEVALSQEIMLPADANEFSFDFDWTITCDDPLGTCAGSFGSNDVVQASFLVAGSPVLNLFPASIDPLQLTASGTATTDISSYAGQTVVLEFLLQDGDFNEADMFSVGNIGITVAPAVAPEPTTLAPFALGLAGFAARRRLAS